MTTLKFKTNLTRKICATFLDYGVFLSATYIYIMFFGEDTEEGGRKVSGLLALVVPLSWFIYFIGIEAFYGATFAHQGFNLRILSLNRKEIKFSQAFKRHLLDPVDFMFFGLPALIAIKNSDKHQRIGDIWAKTVVVNTTDPEQYFVSNRTTENK